MNRNMVMTDSADDEKMAKLMPKSDGKRGEKR